MYNSVLYRKNGMPNNRFGGGFAVPFLLGGITGGLLAPAFYPRPIYPRPIYQAPVNTYPYPYSYPYPYY